MGDNLYWILEYGKVFLAYCFLMFVWPSVVFHRLLKGKSLTFRVCFCPVCSVVLINTVVLSLGLLHILNKWVVCFLFFGHLLFCLLRIFPLRQEHIKTLKKLCNREYGLKLFLFRTCRSMRISIGSHLKKLRSMWKPHLLEYLVLFILILYGMVYFSWGAFQDYSYGFSDMNVHHSWIYNLTRGKIFSAGVYPEAMHCFIYAMHTLFGIRIYSCNLFLEGIHILLLLLSIYCLLKEIFKWRGSALFAIALFLVVKMDTADGVYSLSRLQCTLPQEFGFFTIFLCAVCFIHYLKSDHHPLRGRKRTRLVWDENLLVFGLAISASLSIHFYVTIMAVILCAGFPVFSLRKTLRKTHFVPLMTAAFLGVFLSIAPMIGALASGIRFEGSINWALSIMRPAENADSSEAGTDTAPAATPVSTSGTENASPAQSSASTGQDAVSQIPAAPGKPETSETDTAAPKGSAVTTVINLARSVCLKLKQGLAQGWFLLYPHQGRFYLLITVLSVILLVCYRIVIALVRRRVPDFELKTHSLDNYAPMLMAACLFVFFYAAPMIGLPELIQSSRLCSITHLLLATVTVMPLDLLFSIVASFFPLKLVNTLSVCSFAAACTLIVYTGYYRGYLYFALIRYNSAVELTEHLIENYAQNTYTIVSPTDELYQTIQYGRHTDLYEFMNQIKYNDEYYIPTEYIFVYVEKYPLAYAQNHFFHGSPLLAQEIYPDLFGKDTSQCPDILSGQVSRESAEQIFRATNAWPIYTHVENRTILESRAYFWCENFASLYTYETDVYYEDESFICYRIHQNPQRLFNLVIDRTNLAKN